MQRDQADKALQTFQPDYFILGFMSDGMKGIPPTYKTVSLLASKDNVFDMMRGLEKVRVFSLTETATEGDEWLQLRNKFFAEKTVKEEKELLSNLQQKYPNG